MALVLSLALWLQAPADPGAAGLEAYKNNHFKAAITHFYSALGSSGALDPFREQELRLYLAFALWQTGRKSEARLELRFLLRKFPEHDIEANFFHPALSELYRSVAAEVRPPNEPASASAAPAQAAQETPPASPVSLGDAAPDMAPRAPAQTLTVQDRQPAPTPPGLIFLRCLPFGIGQFANGDPGAGAAWLVVEALLLAANVTSAVLRETSVTPYGYVRDPVQETALFAVQNATFGAVIALGFFGVLDAHLWSPRRVAERRATISGTAVK